MVTGFTRNLENANEGLSILKDNRVLEQEHFDEYKKRKSMIEATYEKDALGRNVLKAIDEDLIKTTEDNLRMIDDILSNDYAIIEVAKQKDFNEYLAWKKRQNDLLDKSVQEVDFSDSSVDTSSVSNTKSISKPKLNNEISMGSMK